MKTRYLIPAYLAIGLLFIRANCDLVSFDQKPLVLTVNIEKIFHVESNSTSYSESSTVNMAQLYEDAGIENPDKISEVSVELLELTILENNTGTGTTASGNLQFQENTLYTLASFTNVNLNSVLNDPLSPFTAIALGVNAAGVNALTTAIEKLPPPTLVLYFTGTASASPIDFTAKAVYKLQVKYAP